MQLRWAKTDSAALGGAHVDTWNLFYQKNPTATGAAVAWVNAGTNFKFGTNGKLTAPTTPSITLTGVAVGGQTLGNISVSIGASGLTQYATTGGTATINQISQNGYPAGQLQSVAISNSGLVIGTFSNGQNINLASVTLSHFNGTNYLKSLDGGAYAVTDQSGAGDYRRFRHHQRFVAGRLQHRHRRRVHQTDRDPAGLFGQHQGHHHRQQHGAGSAERAALMGKWRSDVSSSCAGSTRASSLSSQRVRSKTDAIARVKPGNDA